MVGLSFDGPPDFCAVTWNVSAIVSRTVVENAPAVSVPPETPSCAFPVAESVMAVVLSRTTRLVFASNAVTSIAVTSPAVSNVFPGTTVKLAIGPACVATR